MIDPATLRWGEEVGNLFEVGYIGMVELAFDEAPTPEEFTKALAENLADRIAQAIHYGYLNPEDLKVVHVDEVPLA